MIENIISAYKDTIISLPWIDRYGGLVRKATKSKIEQETGMIFTDIYPVSSDADGRCFETGRYKDLIPDDKFKSVSFFEAYNPQEVSDAVFMNRDTTRFRTHVRFVAWLNLKKLGSVKEYNPEFALNLIDTISQSRPEIAGFLHYTIKAVGLSFRNSDVFGEYSFNELINKLMYPYDYFAVTFQIEMHIQKGCSPAIVLEDPLAC